MSACCQADYDNTFNAERAEEELQNYRNQGIKKSSRTLMAMLRKLPVEGRTLLDIGGGIGAIGFELFKQGLVRSTLVEISSAYVRAFSSEAQRQGRQENTEAIQGDFPAVATTIPAGDLVVLDKVICCYEDYDNLVRSSVGKAKKWYAYTVPRDVWWVRAGHRVDQWINHLKGKKFKTYVHPVEPIEQVLVRAGFRKIDQQYRREWVSVIFEKSDPVVK